MPRTKVFVSYSRMDLSIRDEVLRALRAVERINEALWYDEGEIDIGDKFHPTIQQGLTDSKIGILLLSNNSFTSDYILRHELPYLIEHAEAGDLKLGCLYLTSMAEAAFERQIEIDGHTRTIDLKEYVGAHVPNKPLDTLDPGARAQVYKNLTDWVTRELPTSDEGRPRPTGPRCELAITLKDRGGQWEHSFSLPHTANFARPVLDCPVTPAELFAYPSRQLDGEDLFALLFGANPQRSGEILGAAFETGATADPTRYLLRVRLMVDDDRLRALPWGQMTYQGRRLSAEGWTVELHDATGSGFPEYPHHTCAFPGKVVLSGGQEYVENPQGAAHIGDVQRFFQRHWQEAPEPVIAHSVDALRAALGIGATRLVYYYGSASQEGLRVEGTEGCLLWSDLAALLEQSRSVSVVFLNLFGDTSFDALPQARHLLRGAKAVLVQWNERTVAAAAARAGLAWFDSVLAANERLDPVVALYRHHHGYVAAWTGYSTWRTTAPYRVEMPELVNLLLDRRSQRAELLQAKDDFYTFKSRRVYHTVAFGTAGSRVHDFPSMASQHLRYNKREHEVLLHRSIPITATMQTPQKIDEQVRKRFGIAPQQPVIGTLLQQEPSSGNDFWFLLLGWVVQQPLDEAARTLRRNLLGEPRWPMNPCRLS